MYLTLSWAVIAAVPIWVQSTTGFFYLTKMALVLTEHHKMVHENLLSSVKRNDVKKRKLATQTYYFVAQNMRRRLDSKVGLY